jgi:hypothetical protein
MADYSKANIRLNKIRERNLKPHYKHLNPQEKSLVKTIEAVRQYELSIANMDKGSDPNWRKTEFGGQLLEGYLNAHDKYMRLSGKLDLTEVQENELYNSCHNSRFYGGSY